MGPGQDSGSVVADGGSSFVTEFDSDEPVACAVSRSLAAVKGVCETDLEPLYRWIDIDALERLIRHANGRDGSVTVEFSIDGYRVSVTEERVVRIDSDDQRSSTANGDR